MASFEFSDTTGKGSVMDQPGHQLVAELVGLDAEARAT